MLFRNTSLTSCVLSLYQTVHFCSSPSPRSTFGLVHLRHVPFFFFCFCETTVYGYSGRQLSSPLLRFLFIFFEHTYNRTRSRCQLISPPLFHPSSDTRVKAAESSACSRRRRRSGNRSRRARLPNSWPADADEPDRRPPCRRPRGAQLAP